MRAAIYTRVSTEDQATKGYSLPAQAGECRRKALDQGATEIVEYTDDGTSGGTLDRPALRRLRGDISGRAIDIVVVLDPDRLSRSLTHLLLLADEFESFKVPLVFCTMDWQDTPEGRLFLSMRGAVAEFEKAKIRERMIRGKRQKVAQGGIAQAPIHLFGYTYRDGHLELDEAEAAAVRRIFELSANGMGTVQLARQMADETWAAPSGGRWWQGTVARILRNPAYKGELRQFHKGDRSGPEALVPIPSVVSPQLFAAVQASMDEHLARNPGRAAAVRDLLLAGLARCGVCGTSMCAVGGHNRGKPGGKWPYYACARRRNPQSFGDNPDRRCTNGYHHTKRTDDAVWEAIVALLEEPAEKWRERVQGTSPSLAISPDRDRLEAELAALRSARDRVVALVLRGSLSTDEADGALRENSARSRQLQHALRSLDASEAERQRAAARSMEEVQSLRQLAEGALTPESRKAVAKRLLRSVLVYPDRRVELVPRLLDPTKIAGRAPV